MDAFLKKRYNSNSKNPVQKIIDKNPKTDNEVIQAISDLKELDIQEHSAAWAVPIILLPSEFILSHKTTVNDPVFHEKPVLHAIETLKTMQSGACEIAYIINRALEERKKLDLKELAKLKTFENEAISAILEIGGIEAIKALHSMGSKLVFREKVAEALKEINHPEAVTLLKQITQNGFDNYNSTAINGIRRFLDMYDKSESKEFDKIDKDKVTEAIMELSTKVLEIKRLLAYIKGSHKKNNSKWSSEAITGLRSVFSEVDNKIGSKFLGFCNKLITHYENEKELEKEHSKLFHS